MRTFPDEKDHKCQDNRRATAPLTQKVVSSLEAGQFSNVSVSFRHFKEGEESLVVPADPLVTDDSYHHQ